MPLTGGATLSGGATLRAAGATAAGVGGDANGEGTVRRWCGSACRRVSARRLRADQFDPLSLHEPRNFNQLPLAPELVDLQHVSRFGEGAVEVSEADGGEPDSACVMEIEETGDRTRVHLGGRTDAEQALEHHLQLFEWVRDAVKHKVVEVAIVSDEPLT